MNVWSGELIDRVSERIVGNIFSQDIVVADISDLNPNVMLELGLRLASKKPTVAIVNRGGPIPFDIRDFHVLEYPADLNILDMEEFFERLESSLQEKLTSYASGTYEPFLGKVVVDVLAPETRSIPFNELILDRLDDLAQQISRPQNTVRPIFQRADNNNRITSRVATDYAVFFYTIPEEMVEIFSEKLKDAFSVIEVIGSDKQGVFIAGLNRPKTGNEDKFDAILSSFIKEVRGRRSVPFDVGDSYALKLK